MLYLISNIRLHRTIRAPRSAFISFLFSEASRRSSPGHIPRAGRSASLCAASERPLVQQEADLGGDLGRQDQVQVSYATSLSTIPASGSTLPIVADAGKFRIFLHICAWKIILHKETCKFNARLTSMFSKNSGWYWFPFQFLFIDWAIDIEYLLWYARTTCSVAGKIFLFN